ncbi:hypothetical protein NC653_003133 [Populus alba x Populus x berolinensis]|uniref:Uncharacterized protein n=1 Tax=Populus alba x Populus x berolinensis TaxID=444605 RepID=A0AAD6RQN7_9ROSI|nr:hypothetical protein NC653_003133 [Populus alba x Populus x berolinensis]
MAKIPYAKVIVSLHSTPSLPISPKRVLYFTNELRFQTLTFRIGDLKDGVMGSFSQLATKAVWVEMNTFILAAHRFRCLFFKQEMELSLIGLQNAGKTSLVNVIATGGYSEDMIPTVGFNMRKVTKGNVTIKLWDLGGQPRFRSMWERYCRAVSAIVYVVDAADFDNLSVSRSELHDLLSKPSLSGIPLLVLGNKIDKPGALSKEDFMEQIRGGQNRGPFGPNQATGYVHLRILNFIVLFQGSVQFIFATRAVHSIPYFGAVVNQTLVNVVILLESFTNQICSGASLLKWFLHLNMNRVQVNDFSPMSEAGDRVETGGSALIDEATGSEANGLALIAVSKGVFLDFLS